MDVVMWTGEPMDEFFARLDAEWEALPIWGKLQHHAVRIYRDQFVYDNPKNKIKRAYSRMIKGYDKTSCWSLDHWMAKTIGPQLVYMGEIAHGWPGEERYGTFEQWVEDLKKHGNALIRYANNQDILTSEFRAENYGGDHRAAYEAEHKFYVEEVQVAMHWIADWFGSLWD